MTQAQISGGDVIALSPVRVSVPAVTSQAPDQATSTLQAAGFTVSTARLTVLSECVAAQQGQLVSTTPAAGQQVPAGSRVSINVCDLPEHQIPDVTGEPLNTAENALSALHFYPLPFGVTCTGTPSRTVTLMLPAAGATKPIGTGIILKYCQ